MKYFFTLMFLITMGFAKGQIVYIPDSNFKHQLINQGVDLNSDGEIQESEAQSKTYLSITRAILDSSHIVRDLTGIKAFSNLKDLTLINNRLGNLDLENMVNLESFWSTNDSLLNNNLTGCTNLNLFIFRDNPAKVISLSGLNNLRTISLDNNQLLESAKFSALPNLESLVIGINSTLPYTSYIIEDLPRLKTLPLNYCDSLIIRRCDSLTRVSDIGSSIGYLDIKGCHNLTSAIFQFFYGTSLDFSDCPQLNYFGQRPLYAPNLTNVNIKNGCFTSFSAEISAPNLRYVCADDFEVTDNINTILNTSTPWNFNFSISSYCSFIPGGTYNTITGNTRLDINNNGCDSNDRNVKNIQIKLTDATGQTYITSSNDEGKYSAYTSKGNFAVTPYFAYPYFSINPSSVNVLFDTANNLSTTKDFCIQPNGTNNDLEITFLPTWPAARPGFDAAYTVVYKNRGTTTLSGNVSVNFDNNKMNFVAASENVTTQSSGQLLWNYNNLQPFESKTINVTFNLLPPPVNNIGDTISYLAVITPSDNDETAFDNIFILPQTVIGSFDPNDKQCIEGSKLDISKIGDYLHYQIRFQNEGTDTAFNIVVVDTLSDKLDWNTFEFIGSSHSCDPVLKNNKAEFFFENINLPYKAIDEPGSNGWVAFKIKAKPSVVIGDSLNNSAAIYFDFNLPVITNTATTIVSSSSTPVPVKLEYFSANKKEYTNQLNWKASCTYGNATFVIERSDDGIHFNSIGNITATSLRCQLPFNFTDNNPVAGKNYYRLKIMDADGKSFYSKTLVVGNSKATIEITAVANNTVYLNSNKQQTITIKVIAADGKEILNQKQTIVAGNNNVLMPLKSITSGIYTIIIHSADSEIITKRFVK